MHYFNRIIIYCFDEQVKSEDIKVHFYETMQNSGLKIIYNKRLFHSLLLGLFLFSCAGQKRNSQFGSVQGKVGIFEGNCMPSRGAAPCQATPTSTTVFITSPSENFQMELLKDSVITNSKGEFILKLKTGYYSLFIRDGDEIICDGFNCEKECYCTPFQIFSDSTISVNANIDHAAW